MTTWQPPKPSVFTPFLRRFTDEKSRDLAETRQLLAAVSARHQDRPFSEDGMAKAWASTVRDYFESYIPGPLWFKVHEALTETLELERPIFKSVAPDTNLAELSLQELVDLRRFLRSQEYFLDHEAQVMDTLSSVLVTIFEGLMKELPKLEWGSPFTIPLVHLFHDPLLTIEKVCGTLTDDKIFELGLLTELNQQRYLNFCDVHGIAPGTEVKKVLKPVSEMDMTPAEALKGYLNRTPFFTFLNTPVPLKFDHETRFSHMHVVGGSGAGKTQLLQNLILHDLDSEAPPSLIVVDSQGDLINKLSHLDCFHPDHGKHKGKLTIITPREIDAPPQINIFDINKGRLNNYSPAMREQVVAGVIQTFDYLFSGLLGADLTAKQSVFFRFVARLMLAIPDTMGRNATILDMMNLMDDPGPYREAIETLPKIQRNFFERDFHATGFRQTKEQIRYRLQAILENPTLERLFTAEATKIDLFSEMNRGGIILIDTAKDFLKDGAAHFGRIFISLVLQAALERASIPEAGRKPAFLIVDEAADYFDDNIDDLLTQVRKYKVGCLFAHQFLDQCTSSLRASLAANTASKFCANLSVSDARGMAAEMRTTPDLILKQKKLHFSGFVRNVTAEAVSIPVEAGKLERQPTMSADAYSRLREANRRKVGVEKKPQATEPESTTPDDPVEAEAAQPQSPAKPPPQKLAAQKKPTAPPTLSDAPSNDW